MLNAAIIFEIALSSLLFIVFWQLVAAPLFRSYLSLYEEREAKTSGALKNATSLRMEAKALREQLETELRSARVLGMEQRDKAITKAKAIASETLKSAQDEAASRLSAARAEIASSKQAAMQDVHQQAEQLAQLVISRMLQPSHSKLVH